MRSPTATSRAQGAATRPSRRGPRLSLSVTLLLVLGLVAPLWGPAAPATASPLANEALSSLATLVTQRPEVRWAANGGASWEVVPDRRTVQEGDRVRTGTGARAQLVYFEGSSTVVEPDTEVVVQRLTSTASGNVVTRLFQAIGATVSYVRHLVDPTASFEVETPAAVVFVRGTIPRVQVAPSGFTRVRNEPDRPDSLVGVRGNDPARTVVILLPGQETEVVPGQPPSPPHWPSGTVRPALLVMPTPTLPPPDPCAPSGAGCQPPRPAPCRWPGVTCNPPQPAPDPCQRPNVACDPVPPTDPCRRPNIVCDPPRPDPCSRASVGCQPDPPTSDPCQRPNMVCDAVPPSDPCRQPNGVCDPAHPAPCPRTVPGCRPPLGPGTDPPLSPPPSPSPTTPTIERRTPPGNGQPGTPGQPGAPGGGANDQRPPIRLPQPGQGQTPGSPIR